MFGANVGVGLGRGGVHLDVLHIRFFPFLYPFYPIADVLLMNMGSFPRLSPSEVLPVVLWLVFLMGCLASFGFAPVLFSFCLVDKYV